MLAGLESIGPKPADNADRSPKQKYSQQMSTAIASVLATELRKRGCPEARPGGPGEVGGSGAERRMAGGIGAKKVDVTWSTEEAGLLLAASIKTINFKDSKSGNYQKNLTNRRGDMLFEAVTLHRRFPYSVLLGLFCLDIGAKSDVVERNGRASRQSTFLNAHHRLRLFTDRIDPAGRDEQLEKLYIALVDGTAGAPSFEAYEVGKPHTPVPLDVIISGILTTVSNRNPDFYDYDPATDRMIKLRS